MFCPCGVGFQKKKFEWGVGGWRKLYPSFFLDFWICFNFAKPLSATSSIIDRKSATFLKHNCCTVEPLTNDHPHQRPSLSYDHISCDGQWFYKRGSTVPTKYVFTHLCRLRIWVIVRLSYKLANFLSQPRTEVI